MKKKNVADKAPVTEIQIDNLSDKETTISKEIKKYKYFIIVSDFYYLSTANELKKDLIKKTKISDIFVKKINNNTHRLLIGPFQNFNALKFSYISLNNLGFEELNIYKE